MPCAQSLSHIRHFAAPWTVAHQAPLPMEFSRQVHWTGVPFPTPRDLPNPGIEPASLISPALADEFFTGRATWEAHYQDWKLQAKCPNNQGSILALGSYISSLCIERPRYT